MRFIAALLLVTIMGGCVKLSGSPAAPPSRPVELVRYYAPQQSYTAHREEVQYESEQHIHKHITIESYAGPIVIEFFQSRSASSDKMVFVFPVLGGKNFIEQHLARYFADAGLDAAIVTRSNEFKEPAKFQELESIFRLNIIRDRLAIDFFESEYGKKRFGTFGISRGAINVALTAGVDSRLEFNVMVMGGTDLVHLFRDSDQPRINQYIKSVCTEQGWSEEQFFEALQRQLKSDPEFTAQYIDGRKTLLILGVFDKTVPFTYGLKLREQLDRPDTIFLFADHYLGLLFTQTVSLIPPSKDGGLFPFPYVEEEALAFFNRSFDKTSRWSVYPYRLVQFPLNVIAEGVASVWSAVEDVFDGHSSSAAN